MLPEPSETVGAKTEAPNDAAEAEGIDLLATQPIDMISLLAK